MQQPALVLTSLQHFFHHVLVKRGDRDVLELHLSITSPEMQLPSRTS